MPKHSAHLSWFAAAAFLVAPAAALAAAPAASNTQAGSSASTQTDAQGGNAGGNTAENSSASTAADRDFGRFSKEGAKAMGDIDAARLALFDGQTSVAKQQLDAAETALGKAKSDGAVFERAESELKPKNAGKSDQADSSDGSSASQPVKWLPVGGNMVLGEDYIATPEKKAAVAKADTQLQKGDKKGAEDTLKLHDVQMTFDVDVVPLNKTIAHVNKADQLLASGKYYEANQELRAVQDSMRVNEEIYEAGPNAAGKMAKG